MLRPKNYLAISALLFSTLACVTILGEGSSENEKPEFIITEESQTQNIDPPPQTEYCPQLTDEILQVATSPSESDSEETDNETMLVTYTVHGNEISEPYYEDVAPNLQDEQGNDVAQQQVWDYFTTLIPLENRNIISEYAIFTDGVDNTLAAVIQTETDPQTWSLQVDIADTTNPHNLTFTLIHEFGHLLTLGPEQVPPSIAVFNNPDDNDIYLRELSACPNYFPGEGCANSDSYVNAFFDQFWVDIHEEWNQINLEEDDDIYYEKLDDFYIKYQDQFLTDYAATNPEEDMAEAWAFFILSAQPKGNSIAEQKIFFFHKYPELVELRSTILDHLCTSFPQQ